MPLVTCSDCRNDVSDRAFTCPHCGRPLRPNNFCGYEYRSETTLFGWPLIHIATGMDPLTGRKRVARGIIAVGDVAVGGLAVGGLAIGGIALGGCALGVVALGGAALAVLLAVGGAAVGGIALGGLAIGGVAVGGGAFGYYALGGGAFGVYSLGGNAHDPEAIEFFRDWLGPWVDSLWQRG
jgi:hypothetical protein